MVPLKKGSASIVGASVGDKVVGIIVVGAADTGGGVGLVIPLQTHC